MANEQITKDAGNTQPKSNMLKVQDYISTGVYTGIYFVLMALGTFATGMLITGYSSVFLPGVVGLIAATPYMLLCKKVGKPGAITIMGLVMAIFFFISGHFYLSFVPFAVCSILADFIAGRGGYTSDKWNRAGYVVFAYGCIGPALPLWLLREQYEQSLINRGKDAAYIAKTFNNINNVTLIMCLVITAIGAFIGAVIAQKIVNKHFEAKVNAR